MQLKSVNKFHAKHETNDDIDFFYKPVYDNCFYAEY